MHNSGNDPFLTMVFPMSVSKCLSNTENMKFDLPQIVPFQNLKVCTLGQVPLHIHVIWQLCKDFY